MSRIVTVILIYHRKKTGQLECISNYQVVILLKFMMNGNLSVIYCLLYKVYNM
jgi:hypothetical protein